MHRTPFALPTLLALPTNCTAHPRSLWSMMSPSTWCSCSTPRQQPAHCGLAPPSCPTLLNQVRTLVPLTSERSCKTLQESPWAILQGSKSSHGRSMRRRAAACRHRRAAWTTLWQTRRSHRVLGQGHLSAHVAARHGRGNQCRHMLLLPVLCCAALIAQLVY